MNLAQFLNKLSGSSIILLEQLEAVGYRLHPHGIGFELRGEDGWISPLIMDDEEFVVIANKRLAINQEKSLPATYTPPTEADAESRYYKLLDRDWQARYSHKGYELSKTIDGKTISTGFHQHLRDTVEIAERSELEKKPLEEITKEYTPQELFPSVESQQSDEKREETIVPQDVFLTQKILIDNIVIDESIQSRAKTDQITIDRYAEKYAVGQTLKPVDLFFDGKHHLLADGFHRVPAARKAGRTIIDCIVHQGTKREAFLFAAGANAEHGLPPSPEDIRTTIRKLLLDDEWCKWSDSIIADIVKVTQPTVSRVRRQMEEEGHSFPTRIGKDGKERNVENIGHKKDDEKPAPLFEDSGITVVHDPQKIYEAMRDTAGESQESGVESQESEESPKSDDAKSQESWGHIFALVDKLKANMPDGLLQVTLIEQGFPKEVIDKAIEKHLVERDENGRVFHIFTQEEVVELIQKHGHMNFLELEEAGVKSHVINLAKSNGLIELKSGKFIVHEDDRDSETEEELKARQTPGAETIDESQMEILPPVEDNPVWDNAEIFIKIQLLPKQDGKRIALYSVGEDGVFGDLLDAPADEILSNLPTCILNLIDKVKKEMKERKPVKAQAKKPAKAAAKSPAKKPAKSSTSSKSKSVKSVTKG